MGIDVQFKIKNLRPSKRKNGASRVAEGRADPQRGVLFGPRTKIAEFVEDFKADSKTVAGSCSAVLSAVETANRSHGEENLDTTGAMTAVCRHDIFKLCLQLEHGERYAYGLLTLLLVICGLYSDDPPVYIMWS